ncbi:MAG: DUF4230 domain-containing protein [Nocardioides sp.]|nr:DUF4230 domain-containing protein [Nocardioides sp.]
MSFVLKLTALLIAGVLGFVALAALGVAGLFGLANPFGTEEVDHSQPPILTSIEDIDEYHAAVGNFEVILDVEQDVNWVPDFIAGERSLFVAAGTVDAFVDFSGIADGDVVLSADGTTAEIRLPEAELGEPNLDQERTYLYDQERGLVDRVEDAISSDDQGDIYKLAEEKLRTAAAASELTDQARDNTETMLTGLCRSLGVEVTFVD